MVRGWGKRTALGVGLFVKTLGCGLEAAAISLVIWKGKREDMRVRDKYYFNSGGKKVQRSLSVVCRDVFCERSSQGSMERINPFAGIR